MKQKIKKDLKELADLKYKQFHSLLCPGIENIIGVRVPILRKYSKELFIKKDWKDTIEQIDNEYYEEIMLQGMLIGQAQKEDIKIVLKYIEKFVPKIDNWAICDTFCSGLKITKKYKNEMWKFIEKYLKSNNEFEIRFAVVMILDYYIEEEYLEKIFRIFARVKNEGYYVKMAVAWAISICLIKFYEQTIEFLQNSNLDIRIYNKSIQKAIESYRITNEQKEFLKKMKK